MKPFLLVLYFLSYSIVLGQEDIESELLNLLKKIKESKQNEISQSGDKNLAKIRVSNVYDLRNSLSPLYNLISDTKTRKSIYSNSLEKKINKITREKLNKTQELSNLKNKYETVIAKNELALKNLKDKSIEISKIKSEMENIKYDFDYRGEKFINDLKSTSLLKAKKEIESNNDKDNKLVDFNGKVKLLSNDLNNRKILKNDIFDIKSKNTKEKIKEESMKYRLSDIEYDYKLFNLINGNLESNSNKLVKEFETKIKGIDELRKSLKDKTNLLKFNAEKNRIVEDLSNNRLKLKEIQEEYKSLEKDTKGLMDKKRNLRSQLEKKEIENNLKLNAIKSNIAKIDNSINLSNFELLNKVKSRKDVLFIYNN